MNNFVTPNATFYFYKFKIFWIKHNYDQINGPFRRFYRGAKLFWRELWTSIIIPRQLVFNIWGFYLADMLLKQIKL